MESCEKLNKPLFVGAGDIDLTIIKNKRHKYDLPDFVTVSKKFRNSEPLDPLEQFVYVFEPEGKKRTEEFYKLLNSALEYYHEIKMQKGHQGRFEDGFYMDLEE